MGNVSSCEFILNFFLYVQNNRVRRFAFELKMQDKSGYVLAADSESEMDDWISTLNKILNSSFELAMQDKRNGDLHDGVCVCACRVSRTLSHLFILDTFRCTFLKQTHTNHTDLHTWE